jgi:hypothetical protein
VAAALRAYDVKDGKAAVGEPVKAGLPPVPAKAVAPKAAPGDGPVIVELTMAEVLTSLPTAIPPEIAEAIPTPPVGLATSIAADAEIAAPPHVIEDPATHLPMLLMITRDIARGAAATLIARDFEPLLTAVVAALPNMIMIAPVTATTPPPVR